MSSFPDHFSGRAEAYAKFRPRYPKALFTALGDLVSAKTCALDCATGSGQAAVALAEESGFAKVIATDASADQLSHATAHPSVDYRCAPAEDLSIVEPHSVDLVTVAAGVHWFERARFYAEVKRVLRPGGYIAVWTYGPQANVSPAFDAVVRTLADERTKEDWPPQTELVRALYSTLDFPFDEVEMPSFFCDLQWTLAEVRGVIKTWSGVIRYEERTGRSVFEGLDAALSDAWPQKADAATAVSIPLGLRVGRLS